MDKHSATLFFGSRRWSAVLSVAVIAAATLIVLTRDVLHHPPIYDELLHILAARGVVETGRPVIANGTYDRAELYTRTVALARGLVADELIAARAPAWLAAIILVALVGAWTARKAGWLAGLAAGGLLAIHPWTINLSVFARFYTLHALAIFVAFMCLYEATSAARRAIVAAAFASAAAVALALAWHLQITTVIAIGALSLGIFAGLMADHSEIALTMMRRYTATVTIACIVGAVSAFIIFDRLDLLQTFQEAPLWEASTTHQPNYYNVALAKAMPLFWPLVPFAALGTCIAKPRWGLTLAVAAASTLLVHSVAAPKSARYVYYCLPFICILLAYGLAMAYSLLARYIATGWPSLARAAPWFTLVAFGASLAASQEGYRTSRLLLGLDPYSKVLAYGNQTSWSSAQQVLMPLAAKANAIVTSNAMKAIYYLGRYDYELNASIVAETDTRTEFGIDERTGRAAISRPESLDQVLRAHAMTLIIAENEKVGLDYGVPAETVVVARERCDSVTVPDAVRISVWWCTQGTWSSTPPAPAAKSE